MATNKQKRKFRYRQKVLNRGTPKEREIRELMRRIEQFGLPMEQQATESLTENEERNGRT